MNSVGVNSKQTAHSAVDQYRLYVGGGGAGVNMLEFKDSRFIYIISFNLQIL